VLPKKGYSAVPIGEPFEEPFLVPGRTLSHRWFYMEPKKVLLWGQPKNPFGTLFFP
jgi:hypothetical protein